MLFLVTSNGVGMNERRVEYGLSVSGYQGIYTPLRQQHGCKTNNAKRETPAGTCVVCQSIGIEMDGSIELDSSIKLVGSNELDGSITRAAAMS
jgi:hypothetical protein